MTTEEVTFQPYQFHHYLLIWNCSSLCTWATLGFLLDLLYKEADVREYSVPCEHVLLMNTILGREGGVQGML